MSLSKLIFKLILEISTHIIYEVNEHFRTYNIGYF